MEVSRGSAVDAHALDLYAPWGSRAGAWLIDGVLLWVVFIGAAITLAHMIGTGRDYYYDWLLLVGPAVYFTLGHGSESGQTLGKRACGIAVRDARTFGRLSYGMAFWRWLSTALLWLTFVLGLIDGFSPLGQKENRAWHDRAARSVVIRL
jgi:uncharacterized RDD family membrane protein YckC